MIIQTLLDTDLYKLTMQQAVFHQFPNARVAYAFSCRTPGVALGSIAADVQEQVDSLQTLRLTEDELAWLAELPFFREDYLAYLRDYRMDASAVTVVGENDGLVIRIAGTWADTILFEVPVLAIVNEIWFAGHGPADLTEGRRRLQNKVAAVRTADTPGFTFVDFGTRRRYSREWHAELLATLAEQLPQQCAGTSNVHLARTLGLKPVGTMAHEWLMAAQVLAPSLQESQRCALQRWLDEYDGALGIALSDVVGFEAFMRDFTGDLARRYSGCRHDSGDPVWWAEKLIAHYESEGIDPATKVAVFSDGLTMDRAMALSEQFAGRIRTSFGIGTSLTNDVGVKPLQIVIKMVECNGRPVAKISDSPGKQMCRDEGYLRELGEMFGGE